MSSILKIADNLTRPIINELGRETKFQMTLQPNWTLDVAFYDSNQMTQLSHVHNQNVCAVFSH